MGNKPEIIAFHLPQFHCIKENDEWWGKGFTEWVNTKKAEPLFDGHYQPRVPLGDNYYDLTEEDTLSWQFGLARKYGISAFCYYHYWFNGKLMLQKPLEIMRRIQSRVDYFFCWANEPWTRAWEGSKQVLVEQQYGSQEEWQAHFDYLVGFFSDERYKKIDGKPVFILYRSNNIPNCKEMIEYWDGCCKKTGFNGIYIIEERNNFQTESACKNAKAILDFEPMFTITHKRSIPQRFRDKLFALAFNKKTDSNMLVFDYDTIWQTILKRKYPQGKKHYIGAFVDWDNSARKGKNATVIRGYTPQKFEKYLRMQYERCQGMDCRLLFINAWNEWGEGAYLEPDELYGYKNLEIIKKVQEETE